MKVSGVLSPPSSLFVVPSPTIPISDLRSPAVTPNGMSPSASMSSFRDEAQDDIAALSAGFDRKRTLRRRLSTVGDSPPDQQEFLTQIAELQFTFEQDEDEALNKPAPKRGLEDVLDQLKKVLEYRGRNVSHITVEKAVKDLCTSYEFLQEREKLDFFNIIAEKYSVNHENVTTISKSLVNCTDENTRLNIQEKLRTALIPQYQWLFSQIGRLEGGVKFLVDLRTDLCEIPLKFPDASFHLKTMNNSLRDLIAMWFAVGFLSLERVTWQSSCEMLQKISEYEAVHPMKNWTDLKRRVGAYRRCFVFTHGSMPGEPVVVLHTALTDHIPSSIGSIVSNARTRMMSLDSSDLNSTVEEDPDSITTAIFYSITSTQKGLVGIELGNYLIKQVVKELQKEFPRMSRFSSLSPIPGFRSWLLAELKVAQKGFDEGQYLLTTQEFVAFGEILGCENPLEIFKLLHNLISSNEWASNDKLVSELENPLMRLCARYLVMTKRRGFAMDSVANFHLKNGAVIWRLNWRGNLKPRGLTQSCGIMVNYRYFLEDCESNSQNYMENQEIKISDSVHHLVKLAKTQGTPPISPSTSKM